MTITPGYAALLAAIKARDAYCLKTWGTVIVPVRDNLEFVRLQAEVKRLAVEMARRNMKVVAAGLRLDLSEERMEAMIRGLVTICEKSTSRKRSGALRSKRARRNEAYGSLTYFRILRLGCSTTP
jgi:hypothetical protein